LKRVLRIVGGLFILMGAVWFFQGINVLPGSFMTGQVEWAIYGGLSVVLGAGLLILEPVQAVTALIVVLIPTGVPRGSGSHLAEDGFSRVGLAGVALSSSRAS